MNGCFVLFKLLSCFGLWDMFFFSFVGDNFMSIGRSRFYNYQIDTKMTMGLLREKLESVDPL